MLHWSGAFVQRLRRGWFGSALALLGFAILTVAPVARHCAGISAARGSAGGIFCGWTPPLQNPAEPGLMLLLLFATAIIIVPLAFPYRWVLLASGVATAAVVAIVVLTTSMSFSVYLALSRLGLDMTSEAVSGLLALLPASAAWIYASFRLRARPAP